MSDMVFEAHIAPAWATFSHGVWLRHGDYLIDGEGRHHPLAYGSAFKEEHRLCYIPHGAGYAILAELARVLGAVEHPEQLRADYLAERARVDKFIDMLKPKAR